MKNRFDSLQNSEQDNKSRGDGTNDSKLSGGIHQNQNFESETKKALKSNRPPRVQPADPDTLDYIIRDMKPLQDQMNYHPILIEYFHIMNDLLPMYEDL